MASAAAPDPRDWAAPALLLVGVLTALRVAALAVSPTDLFVDEAQYWLWSEAPAFGYYSKPPLVAWVIALSTGLGGSDAAFWIRLPAPLLHAATALILGRGAAGLWGAPAGVAAAALWITLPLASVGSFMISTDTVMAPFLAGAILAWLVTLRGGGRGTAALAGALLGLAALAKYAALYFLAAAGLAALVPALRPRGGEAGAALAALALVLAPNLAWNLGHGFATLQHTLDNADWVRDPSARAGLHPVGWLRFLAEQAAVFGPIPLAGLAFGAATLRRRRPRLALLLGAAAGIVLAVSLQALVSRAYANWAASAYLAGTLAVAAILPPLWRWLAVAMGGAIALLVAAAVAFPARVQPLEAAMERYAGRAAMSRAIIAAAAEAGLGTVVAADRDILADLFHTGRGGGLAFRAPPPAGRPENHYELAFPLAAGDGPALWVLRPSADAPCPEAEPVGTADPGFGTWEGRPQALWRAPAGCGAP